MKHGGIPAPPHKSKSGPSPHRNRSEHRLPAARIRSFPSAGPKRTPRPRSTAELCAPSHASPPHRAPHLRSSRGAGGEGRTAALSAAFSPGPSAEGVTAAPCAPPCAPTHPTATAAPTAAACAGPAASAPQPPPRPPSRPPREPRGAPTLRAGGRPSQHQETGSERGKSGSERGKSGSRPRRSGRQRPKSRSQRGETGSQLRGTGTVRRGAGSALQRATRRPEALRGTSGSPRRRRSCAGGEKGAGCGSSAAVTSPQSPSRCPQLHQPTPFAPLAAVPTSLCAPPPPHGPTLLVLPPQLHPAAYTTTVLQLTGDGGRRDATPHGTTASTPRSPPQQQRRASRHPHALTAGWKRQRMALPQSCMRGALLWHGDGGGEKEGGRGGIGGDTAGWGQGETLQHKARSPP